MVSAPQQALDHLQTGRLQIGPDWERAHEICQQAEGERAHDLVHALCHWIEGDLANRDYWYRRAGRHSPAATIGAEWAALKATLT
jgi:hypothetical protein